MVSREQVIEALAHIYDATYNRPVTELNLIKDVMVKPDQAAVTFVLTADDEQLKAQYRQDVEEAISRLGVADVHIRFRPINDFEKQELAALFSGDKAGEKEKNPPKKEIPTHAPKEAPLLSPESKTQFIAVASGKGGVGKSTVTVNLAVSLARLGKRVGIVDADIYGFSVPDMMGIETRPALVDKRIIPVERFGVKVISMGFFVEDNSPIIWRGPMLGKMLRNFFSEVEWGELDYLILDLPPGTGDIALDVHQMIPQSKELIVTTPHATAAFVAARAGAMALHTNHEILGIVENMSYYETSDGKKDYVFGRGGGAKLAEELHTELLAQIPLGAPDNHVAEPDFSPSVYKEGTPTAGLYLEVAQKIVDKLG
ncbi:Mrp/NBP35 family ATP-binding protein [Paenibacillus senegalensis]|uniref:Mrp/NBP35 family ATP-binding protein n=1 Tax=Paenibacillus senegalensis TaxID=1465766 RepID=UPI000289FA97|nr:Mrp/NBP35 family ATP-binding protein [Paenibacillus senegalensis]